MSKIKREDDLSKRIIAIVGMCGSGKSVACESLQQLGWMEVHFGALTIEELKKNKLSLNPKNEKFIREKLRKQHGMAVYAKLSIRKIKTLMKHQQRVVINGLYSWDEYLFLAKHFKDALILIEIYTDKTLRYQRLAARSVRPLTPTQAAERDKAEIENLAKGGPIAFADYKIANNSSADELKKKLKPVLKRLKKMF